MNSDPNQPQPTTGPAPEPPVTPEVPADISGDDATVSAVSGVPADPIIPAVPETPAAPEMPVAPETSVAPEAPAVPEATPANDAPSTEPVSEAEAIDQLADAAKEAEELTPAEPVPGAIGSAFNYSATAPDHSEPTPKKLVVEEPKPAEEPAPETPAVEPAPVVSDTPTPVEAPAPVATAESATAAEPAPIPTEPAPIPTEPAPAEPVPAEPILTEPTPAPTEPTPAAPEAPVAAPKTKKSSLILALVIIAAVVLIAVVVIFVLMIISNSSKNGSTTKVETTVSEDIVEESSLICTRISTSEEVSNSALASYELKMIANYYGEDLSDIATTGTYNYISPEAAAEGATQARLAYAEWYRSLDLTTDPFSSSYPVSGNTFTASHLADADEITVASAPLFYLNVENGFVLTDAESVRAVYTGQGYTCSGSNDENAAEETADELPGEADNLIIEDTTEDGDEEVIEDDTEGEESIDLEDDAE